MGTPSLSCLVACVVEFLNSKLTSPYYFRKNLCFWYFENLLEALGSIWNDFISRLCGRFTNQGWLQSALPTGVVGTSNQRAINVFFLFEDLLCWWRCGLLAFKWGALGRLPQLSRGPSFRHEKAGVIMGCWGGVKTSCSPPLFCLRVLHSWHCAWLPIIGPVKTF